MLGLLVRHSSSASICTLSMLMVLMSTSTTAQLLGGNFVGCFSDTDILDLGRSSFVSAIGFMSMRRTLVRSFVQWTPAQLSLAKSFSNMTALHRFWHTRKVCLNVLFLILISQVAHPRAPKLLPSALTTLGNLVVSSLPRFSSLYISSDITLLVASVSKRKVMFLFLILAEKVVPSGEPSTASILHISCW